MTIHISILTNFFSFYNSKIEKRPELQFLVFLIITTQFRSFSVLFFMFC